MTYSETVTRAYVKERFPRASSREQEKLIADWLTKPTQSEGIATDFERRVGPLRGLRVLDAGSGNGGISIAFAKRGAEVEGVDIEDDLIKIAKAEAMSVGSKAHFTLYDGITLPFPDKMFDATVSVSVIEHVDNPINYLSEILRVLKPGGTLYFAFPNRLNPKETHTGLWGLTYLSPAPARFYVRMTKHNPLEDNGLHFYTFWNMQKMLRSSESNDRVWTIRDEKGASTNFLKRFAKNIMRMLGIPYQAFLPHIMLVVEAK